MSNMKDSNTVETLSTCPDCGKELTPEEKLLQAIFDDRKIKCQECFLQSKLLKCTKCGEVISNGIEVYFKDSPYHPQCFPTRALD